MKPERLDLRPERLDLRPERLDLRPERPDLRSQCPDLRPEGPNEGGDERTNGQTNKRTKVPCVLQDIVPFGAAAQKAKDSPQLFFLNQPLFNSSFAVLSASSCVSALDRPPTILLLRPK